MGGGNGQFTFFLPTTMDNYFFSQIGPYTGYKYLDSHTSEKANESLSIITEQKSLKSTAKMSFFFSFLNIQLYLSFLKKFTFLNY